jgi:pimeloyl-ACP methyl ester carboxylesterase
MTIMRTTTVDIGTPVTLREWGSDGPAVLFLHAMGSVSSGAMVGACVAPLLDAGFRVVAPDLPGHGDTAALDADGYELDKLAAWVWDVLGASGLDHAVVIGHSWGGAIACHLQAQHSDAVDALVLVDSGHVDYADLIGDDVALSLDGWVAQARQQHLRVSDRAELAAELELAADDPIMDLLLVGMEYDDSGAMVSRVSPETRGAARYHLARTRQSQTWETIGASGTPTLLLLATEPPSARAQNEAATPRFQAAVPHADIRLVPGATHSMVTDLRADFGTIVANWLATIR